MNTSWQVCGEAENGNIARHRAGAESRIVVPDL
jgi:hypothetical protein